MRKYEDSKGTNHTTIGLAWRRRHIFIVNSDDREVLHWFLCAMDYVVLVWAFNAHAPALRIQEDGWSCGYPSLHLCDELVSHRGSLDDVDVTPLPKGFIKEALRIINPYRSVQVPSTIRENGW